ncbi:uncharacterized protein TNCV_527581 [Trichonephila clavipes]|nr:uncharacterized protein TNCV_527581 [Trichonephila clavipes]
MSSGSSLHQFNLVSRVESREIPKMFTCRNCGGGDRGRVAIYRPFGEVSLSLNRTVTCMVLKANDRRTSCPCHDEFRGPRSDYVRQVALATTTTSILQYGSEEVLVPHKFIGFNSLCFHLQAIIGPSKPKMLNCLPSQSICCQF